MLRFVRDLIKDIEALCELGGDIAGLVFHLLDEGGVYQVPMPCYHFPAAILDGAEYETKVTCPSCMNTGDHSFDLNEVSVRTMDDVENDDSYEVTEEGSIVAVTPMTKITVEMKLMTGKDESYLSRLTESKRKKKLPETTLTDTLKILITSLNGETSPDLIKKFIKVMPARDSRFLRSVYEKASPNIDMTQDFECSTCGYVTDLEVPFTPDFFWPKQ